MVNWFEGKLIAAMIKGYPEWRWTPQVVALGKWFGRRIMYHPEEFKTFSEKRAGVIERIKLGFVYARTEAVLKYDDLVSGNAIAAFTDCFFLNQTCAVHFFRVVHYPRYIKLLLTKIVPAWIELFTRTEHGQPNYVLYRICIEVYYHEIARRVAVE